MLENKVLVKHKRLGYEGVIDGQTSLRILFTGNKAVPYQYRIKIANQDKRFIAPEEDLRKIKAPIVVKRKKKVAA